jgi:methylated-DNA-[protein]-cysteine S-methyltransferase
VSKPHRLICKIDSVRALSLILARTLFELSKLAAGSVKMIAHYRSLRKNQETPMNTLTAERTHVATVRSTTSQLGAIAVAVRDGVVIGVRFGYSSESAALRALLRSPGCEERGAPPASLDSDELLAEDLIDRLQRYASGDAVDFSDVPTEASHLSTFQRRVVKACRAIPAGQRRTYGQLAAAAGSPGAARAVGQVMAMNRVPLIVPCHRVVASGGGLGGFSAPQGLAMKRKLLELEAAALFD